MSRTYAWRALACLPILKGFACTNVNKDWQADRCCALYQSAMAHIITDVNDICSTDRHFRFADTLVRRGHGGGGSVMWRRWVGGVAPGVQEACQDIHWLC